MTFTIKVRGAPTGPVRHDYLCPVHGRFEAEVPREAVPDVAPCPEHVENPEWWGVVSCGEPSPWSPSPVTGRVRTVEAYKGTSDKPPPGAVSTRDLAEGMPMSEWRARRRERQRQSRHAQLKSMGIGPKRKTI